MRINTIRCAILNPKGHINGSCGRNAFGLKTNAKFIFQPVGFPRPTSGGVGAASAKKEIPIELNYPKIRAIWRIRSNGRKWLQLQAVFGRMVCIRITLDFWDDYFLPVA